jgi:hypothetical protein
MKLSDKIAEALAEDYKVSITMDATDIRRIATLVADKISTTPAAGFKGTFRRDRRRIKKGN